MRWHAHPRRLQFVADLVGTDPSGSSKSIGSRRDQDDAPLSDRGLSVMICTRKEAMRRPSGFIECCPTKAAKPPFGPGWVHKIKPEGFCLLVCKVGTGALLHQERQRLGRTVSRTGRPFGLAGVCMR
jgi:hypothetical protein